MKSKLGNVVKVATVSLLVLGGWTQVYGLTIQNGDFSSGAILNADGSLGNSYFPGTPNQSWFVQDARENEHATWAIVDGYALATPGQILQGGSAWGKQDLRQYYLAVDPNTTYTITFDYIASGAGFNGTGGMNNQGASLVELQALEFSGIECDKGGQLVSVTGLGDIKNATTGWTSYSTTFTTGSGTYAIGLKIGALFGDGAFGRDSFSIDNVMDPPTNVPDGGMTMTLLGLGMAGLGMLRRKLS